jgi:hypothetical protein
MLCLSDVVVAAYVARRRMSWPFIQNRGKTFACFGGISSNTSDKSRKTPCCRSRQAKRAELRDVALGPDKLMTKSPSKCCSRVIDRRLVMLMRIFLSDNGSESSNSQHYLGRGQCTTAAPTSEESARKGKRIQLSQRCEAVEAHSGIPGSYVDRNIVVFPVCEPM